MRKHSSLHPEPTQSEDENLLAGSGQGDPKSAFNLSVPLLNHLLASQTAILRNASPVFFADDDNFATQWFQHTSHNRLDREN